MVRLACALAAGIVIMAAADFDIVDEREFRKLFPAGARVERLATGLQFTEGPVWHPDGYLIFSDIRANELKRWDPAGGVRTFRSPSHDGNGNIFDREGRLLTAEHTTHRITRLEPDGSLTTLVDAFEGKPLNSPNDLVVKSDGTIWFTDPRYGLGQRQREQPGYYVYRLDPATRAMAVVIKDVEDQPNGLCFSPDESLLYVADSGKPHHIRRYRVERDGTVRGGDVFVTIDKGGPDGIRCDAAGRIWSSAGDGVQIFMPDGRLVARVLLPETAANLTFGGPQGTTLFVTARTSLYAVETLVTLAARPK